MAIEFTVETLFIMLLLVVSLVIVLILIMLNTKARKIIELQKEMLHANTTKTGVDTLLFITKTLSDKEHIQARKIVYESYLDYKKAQDLGIFRQRSISHYVDLVKADFDEIGVLFQNKYLDENSFFGNYSDTVRRCWMSLEDDIKRERIERQSNEFMKFFEFLAIHAKEFRARNGLGEPTIIDFREKS